MPKSAILESPELKNAIELNEVKINEKAPRKSKRTLVEVEAEILEFSGLELNKELFVYDVNIEMSGKIYSIHTYRCGDGNTEDLVLLHGYGGSALLYYKMLKILSQRFRVFCIDFAGMGLSSKQKFECTTAEETIDFFVTSIEKWREGVGLDTFHLGGHSFGGYMAGQYALRYQERVKKLSLLSPMGFTNHQEEINLEEVKKRVGWFKFTLFRMLQPLIMKLWNNKVSPYSMARNKPCLTRRALKNYVYKRFELKDPEAGLVNEYMFGMLSSGEGSETAIHNLAKMPFLKVIYPLEERVGEELKIPVDCYNGDVDYMDSTGARRLYASKKKANFEFKIVPKSAHQVTIQAPKDLAEEMVRSAKYTSYVVSE